MTLSGIHVRAFCFLLLAFILSGCTKPYYGYPGPRLPETETALLTPDVGVKIYSLNGEVVNIKHESQPDLLMTTRAILRPGLHQLVLVPQFIESAKTFSEVNALLSAGRQYRVRTQRITGTGPNAGQYEFWVEDAASGEVVSDRATSRNPFRQ